MYQDFKYLFIFKRKTTWVLGILQNIDEPKEVGR